VITPTQASKFETGVRTTTSARRIPNALIGADMPDRSTICVLPRHHIAARVRRPDRVAILKSQSRLPTLQRQKAYSNKNVQSDFIFLSITHAYFPTCNSIASNDYQKHNPALPKYKPCSQNLGVEIYFFRIW
jgi:hypothetical protein